jgi:hypothetical protein
MWGQSAQSVNVKLLKRPEKCAANTTQPQGKLQKTNAFRGKRNGCKSERKCAEMIPTKQESYDALQHRIQQLIQLWQDNPDFGWGLELDSQDHWMHIETLFYRVTGESWENERSPYHAEWNEMLEESTEEEMAEFVLNAATLHMEGKKK